MGIFTTSASAGMSGLKFSRTPARALNTEIKGPPSYSSTNNVRDVVHSLPLRVKLNVLLTGKGNRALPAGYQIDLDRDIPALIGAVSHFTQLLAKRDFLAMKPLVTENCRRELRKVRMQQRQRSQTIVSPDEVFFSYVSDMGKSENDFNLVIMYKPTFPNIQKHIEWTNKSYQGYGDINKQQLKAPLLMLFRRNKRKKDNPSKSKYWNMMRTNPIVIANIRFSRENDQSDWMISRAGQVNTQKVWGKRELDVWDHLLWVTMLKESKPEWKEIREVLAVDVQQETDDEKKRKIKFAQKFIGTPPSSLMGNVLQCHYLILLTFPAVICGGAYVLTYYTTAFISSIAFLPLLLLAGGSLLEGFGVMEEIGVLWFPRLLGNWRFRLNFNLSKLIYFRMDIIYRAIFKLKKKK